MALATIFSHGTGSGSAENMGNIIEIMHKMSIVDNDHKKLILEGPGSAQFHRLPTSQRRRLPANLRTELGMRQKKWVRPRWAMLAEGGITGHGMGSNTGRAFLFLKGLRDANVNIDKVNLIGWSRGAVTCFRIAYYIDKHLGNPKPEVNIFAIDPVEGENIPAKFGWGKTDRRQLPAIVANLIVILAMDEKRTMFIPSDDRRLQVNNATNHCFLPFPGRHLSHCYRWLKDFEQTQVTNMYDGVGGTNNIDVLKDASALVWQLAYKFLVKQGTTFNPANPASYDYDVNKQPRRDTVQYLFNLNNDNDAWRLLHYNNIHNNKDVYEHVLRTKNKNTDARLFMTAGGRFRRRNIKKGGVWRVVKYPKLFVNDHHMYLHSQVHHGPTGLEPQRRIHMKTGKSFGKSMGSIYHLRQGQYTDLNTNWVNMF